jgi:hypothetical protein
MTEDACHPASCSPQAKYLHSLILRLTSGTVSLRSRMFANKPTKRPALWLFAANGALLSAMLFTAGICRFSLASGDHIDPVVVPAVWPENAQFNRLSEIGRGKAIIFSPDFSAPGNREFYQKLGFVYFEDPSWERVLSQIASYNHLHPENRIEVVILETHGTNGNGLKLQVGAAPAAARSYISLGALQERLEQAGVRLCIVGACNAGRLYRPEIYKALKEQTGDRLFLPPTLGIINSSDKFDPSKSEVIMARRAESRIETTNEGDISELSPIAQQLLGLKRYVRIGRALRPRPVKFVVSNMLVQMLIHDPRLHMTATGYTTEKSREDYTDEESEELFQQFLAYLNRVAAREYQIAHGQSEPAQIAAAQATIVGARPIIARPGLHRRNPAAIRSAKRALRRVVDD